jgi:hypothetical protein
VAGYNFDLNLIIKGLGGVTQLSNSLNRLEKQGASLGNTFRFVRAALVAFGGTQVIGRALELEKTIEKTRLSLNALAGSIAAGNQAYQEAAKFSAQFGFELDKTLKATQGLLLAGINLNQIPSIMQMLGGAARATGADVDNLAEEFIKLKTSGAASAKTLGPILEQYLGKVVYDTIKENGDLSLAFFQKLGPQLGDALLSGTGGLNQALNTLSQNFDKFIQSLLGTDNAEKINHLNKALERLTEQLPALQIGLGALLSLTGKGAFVGVPLMAKGFYDLYMQSKDAGLGVKSLKEQLDESKKSVTELNGGVSPLILSIGQLNSKFTEAPIAISATTAEMIKMSSSTKAMNDQMLAMKISVGTTLDEINKQFSTMNILTDVLRSGFNNVSSAATEAFVGILKGTMSARDAGRMLADAIVTELLTAFVRLFIVGPIMAYIADQLGMIIKTDEDTARAVERTNRALQKQIGLRLLLMALGLSKGGPVQAGGQPAQARATGGTVSGNMPYLVGERGPELFMPNSNGNIIPNDKLNMGGGSDYGSSAMGSANITFNINTVDARDFDKLLMTRQDMIIGMINKGLQERGKRSLTA